MPTRTSDQKSSSKPGGRGKAPTKGNFTPAEMPRRSDERDTNHTETSSAGAVPEASSGTNGKAGRNAPTVTDIEHFQSLLLTERARLEEEREQIRSRSGSVDGALPEEGEGGDEDTADLAAAMMDKEMDLSVEDEIEDLLAAVDHALQKIEDGTYGICDMSGEPIPVSRLELIP